MKKSDQYSFERLFAKLPNELHVFKEVIADECQHALQVMKKEMGLVEEKELRILQKQCRESMSQINELEDKVSAL